MQASAIYALWLATVASCLPNKRAALMSCVENALGDDALQRIVQPADETYTDARLGEHIQFEQLPAIIAFVDDASEVAPLIQCAKDAGIKAVPRTGGHHFLGYSALSDTLVIDISHIDYVQVSEDKETAKVGGGIRLGPLYAALNTHERDWPGGICPTVGLSGFLGAGGFNMQMRQLGLAVDHVEAVKVITASGRVVDASMRKNQDLFWAMRGGGGGSYGIAVEWTLKLTQFPRSAMVLIKWNEPDTSVDVASRFLDWAPYADTTFTSQVNVRKNRTEVLGWCLGCSVEKAQRLVDDSGLLSLGKPEVHITGGCNSLNARMVGYVVDECIPDEKVAQLAPYAVNHVQQPFTTVGDYAPYRWNETKKWPEQPDAKPWPRFRRVSKSFFMQKTKKLSRDDIAEVVDRLQQLPAEAEGWGEWHAWNVAGVSAGAAFAWRDEAVAHLEFIIRSSDDEEKHRGYLEWSEALEKYLRPKMGPASYPGYMDANISSEPLRSYYGKSLDLLKLIKLKHDPKDFFDNPLGVPPASFGFPF